MAKAAAKDTTTAKYAVLRRIQHDGEFYDLGDMIELTADQYAELSGIGAVRARAEQAPEQKAAGA